MKTIIEMARKANFPACHTTHSKALERFDALVRADERERLSAGVEMPEPAIQASLLMPEKGGLYGPCYTADQLREFAAAAVARKDAEIDTLKERVKFTASRWEIECKSQVEIEQEACAKVADEHMQNCAGQNFGVGAAIRARGNT